MCASNCLGVDPNSIIGGGVAAVALSGLAGQALLGPALGVGGLTLAGGAAAMGMFNCRGDTPCRVSIQSCTSVRSENVPDCEGLSSSYQDCWEDSLPEFCRIVKHLSSIIEKSQKKLY